MKLRNLFASLFLALAALATQNAFAACEISTEFAYNGNNSDMTDYSEGWHSPSIFNDCEMHYLICWHEHIRQNDEDEPFSTWGSCLMRNYTSPGFWNCNSQTGLYSESDDAPGPSGIADPALIYGSQSVMYDIVNDGNTSNWGSPPPWDVVVSQPFNIECQATIKIPQ